VGMGRLDPVRFEAAPGQEPGDALGAGVRQEIGGAGQVAIGREGREAPEGGADQMGRVDRGAGLRPGGLGRRRSYEARPGRGWRT